MVRDKINEIRNILSGDSPEQDQGTEPLEYFEGLDDDKKTYLVTHANAGNYGKVLKATQRFEDTGFGEFISNYAALNMSAGTKLVNNAFGRYEMAEEMLEEFEQDARKARDEDRIVEGAPKLGEISANITYKYGEDLFEYVQEEFDQDVRDGFERLSQAKNALEVAEGLTGSQNIRQEKRNVERALERVRSKDREIGFHDFTRREFAGISDYKESREN